MRGRKRALTLVLACLMATSALAGSGNYNEITRTTTGAGLERLLAGQFVLSATAGQPDAIELQQGDLRLRGGFWPQTLPGLEETATPTATSTLPSETATPSPTLSEPTATSSATPTEPADSTATVTPTDTPPTVVVSVTPSPTRTPGGERDGDANCDGRVGAADFPALIRAIAEQQNAPCGGDDVNGDGEIDAADLADLAEVVFSE